MEALPKKEHRYGRYEYPVLRVGGNAPAAHSTIDSAPIDKA
jgi:hypothetical protein